MEIAVSSWSLRSHINREFPVEEFGRVVHERFGVSAVELCQMHVPRQDAWFLDRILEAYNAAGVHVVNMPIDVGNISRLDDKGRRHDVRIIEGWLEVAHYLGSPCARVNLGSNPKNDLAVTIESLQELAAYAGKLGMTLLVENHGGLSSNPDHLLSVTHAVGTQHFALLPDFGNFPAEIRYAALAQIAPLAAVVHAKTYDFDERGELPQFDFARCLRIVKDAGFDGPVSVEFEGQGDQYAGVEQTIRLIRQHWG
ncbi:MAG TPA: sugar phosphate isomerase/epimerase [Firmicutes bacterium]|nr:sugar phosphate isomerase/epimerase [Bacillota bacterium]